MKLRLAGFLGAPRGEGRQGAAPDPSALAQAYWRFLRGRDHHWIGFNLSTVGARASKIATSAGFTFLGLGRDRAVFRDGGTVVKIVHIPGADTNYREAAAWAGAPSGVRRLLVPVLDSGEGYGWIRMEYVPAAPAAADAAALARRLGPCGFSDVTAENMTVDGRLLDYANVDLARLHACEGR